MVPQEARFCPAQGPGDEQFPLSLGESYDLYHETLGAFQFWAHGLVIYLLWGNLLVVEILLMVGDVQGHQGLVSEAEAVVIN